MNIQPDGEHVRKAVKWISEEKKYSPGQSLKKLVEAASLKFNLSPLEENYLFKFYSESEK